MLVLIGRMRGVEGSQPFKGTNETTDPTGSGFERTSIEAAKSEMGHFLDVGAFLNEARSTPKNGHRQFDPLLPKSADSVAKVLLRHGT